MKTLKDVSIFIRNGANIKQDSQIKIGIPITRIETISNGLFNFDKLGYARILDDRYKDYYLIEDDVLFSHINSEKFIGRTVVYKKTNSMTIIHGMNLLCIRFNKEKYNPNFFTWYSKSFIAKRYFSSNIKRAVNQASITASAVKNMPIPDLTLEKQNYICNNLNIINEALFIKLEQLKAYDELIKSRFIEMFGEVLLNTHQYRLKKLKDLFVLSAGGTPSTKNKAYWENGTISWIGSNLCQDQIIRQNDGKYITQEGYNNSSAKMFDVGTVLIALVGATIGKTGLLLFPTATNQNVLGVQNIEEAGYNPYFVFYYMQELYPKFMELGDGKFKMASKGFVGELEIFEVSIVLQNEFAEYVKLIDKSKFVCHSKNFLCEIFTLVSSTIAYSKVVSIFACPRRC